MRKEQRSPYPKYQASPEMQEYRASKSAKIMKLSSQIYQDSNYLAIKETRQILHSLTPTEVDSNESVFRMLRMSVVQCTNRELPEHVSQEIHGLLSDIDSLCKLAQE